jgi:uncharacterized integral membrane protein
MRRDDTGSADDKAASARSAGQGEDLPDEIRADREHLRQIQRDRQARVVKAIVALAIVAVLILFIITNSQPVEVDFVFVTRHPRLIWVMFACAILGGIAGYLLGRPGRQIRLHRRRDEEQKPGK